MEQKICKGCKKELPIENFGFDKKSKDRFKYKCRRCERIKQKMWRDANKDKVQLKFKKWYDKKIRPLVKPPNWEFFIDKSYKVCSKCKRILDKRHFYKDIRATDKLQSCCKNCMKLQNSNWAINNREAVNAKTRRHKMKSIENLIHARMSNAIWIALNRQKAKKSWIKYVDYSVLELKQHLENNFSEGMSWEKFKNGEIHIDHVKPKSWFKFNSVDDMEFKQCWSLSNLQPLWARENMSKNNRYEGKFRVQLN